MKQGTAIIVASFGTTHMEMLDKSIAATEHAIGSSFPHCRVYRAFTSGMVIHRLREQYGIETNNLNQTLELLRHDGYKKAVIQPTLIMGGFEYEMIRRDAENSSGLNVVVGMPLIDSAADCKAIADILMGNNRLKKDEALVLMGHGTVHSANRIYSQLQDVFESVGYRAFVGTVEGTPTLSDAVKKLQASGAGKAKLLPLMFVAGEHAKNDMAGDDKSSLRSLVVKAGIEAEPILRGLGEDPSVSDLYVKRAGAALEALCL